MQRGTIHQLSATNLSQGATPASEPHQLSNANQTKNEHWLEEGRPSPYEPFPRFDYLAVLFEILDAERIIWLEKSRDLMVSWGCVPISA